MLVFVARDYTQNDLRKEIERMVSMTSQREVASRLGVSPSMICDVLMGRRDITERIAEALGYSRMIVFRKSAA